MTFLITFFCSQLLIVLGTILKIISNKMMIHFLRFSYASFLIFSGSIKLIDPIGFSYKLQEYFEVFGMDFLVPLSLILSITVILFEICLGIFLIYGFQTKKVMWGNLLLMIFFTFLTFFSAYFNKVTDCGCFGDFLKLDPWHSFIKDIHLLFVSLVLFLNQDKINPLLSSLLKIKDDTFYLSKKLLLVKFSFFLLFSIYTISHLPIIDFRPYKIHSDLISGKKLPENAKKDVYEDIWFYEIDGKVSEYTTEEAPWSIEGAVYKDRITKLVSKGDEPLIKDFDIVDPTQDLNITDSLLNLERVALIISFDIKKAKSKSHKKILKYIKSLSSTNLPIYGLSSSSKSEIDSQTSLLANSIPWFLVDQTTLKTIIRSNPGVIILEKGVVVNKWHWRDLPI